MSDIKIDSIDKKVLEEVSDLHSMPTGAYNIRINGAVALRNTTANIDIVPKDDKSGIDIYIKENTKNESVHIPVILSQTGMTDLVYNDFHIGDEDIIHTTCEKDRETHYTQKDLAFVLSEGVKEVMEVIKLWD